MKYINFKCKIMDKNKKIRIKIIIYLCKISIKSNRRIKNNCLFKKIIIITAIIALIIILTTKILFTGLRKRKIKNQNSLMIA